jgi:hypothetical protein
MDERITFVIEAQDNATEELNAMVDSLREMADATLDLGKTSRESAEGVAQIASLERAEAFKDLKASALDAFSAMSAAASEFVDIAAESELVTARMDAQLRALGDATNVTSDQINGLATELSTLTGFDDEALVQAQTALLRFGVTSEEQFDRATRAATDLAAATGMDLSAAFQAVGVAMDTGQWGRLTRQIGALNAEQEAALKAATDAGDAMAAQGIILDALEQKVAGAGEAIGSTWTGKMNIARVETDNLKQSIGDGLLGVLNQLPQGAITAGVAIGDFGGMVGTIAGPIADVAISAKALGISLPALAGVGPAVSGALSSIGAALAAVTLPVWLLIAAIGALIAVWNVFGEDAKKTASMIGQIIGALAKRIAFEMGQAMQTMGTNTKSKLNELSVSFTIWATGIGMKLKTMASSAAQWGRDIVTGLWQGIQAGWSWLMDNLGQALDNLLSYVQSALQGGSPSRLWADKVGDELIAQGIGQGINQGMPGVSGALGSSLMPRNLAPAYAGGGGGGQNIVINLPAAVVADRQYATTQLVPYIREALRRL